MQKVSFLNENEKWKTEAESYDFDVGEDKLYIEDQAATCFKSVVVMNDHSLTPPSSKPLQILTKQRYFSQKSYSHTTKRNKYQKQKPNLPKDGTPVRFSKRLQNQYLRESNRSPTDRVHKEKQNKKIEKFHAQQRSCTAQHEILNKKQKKTKKVYVNEMCYDEKKNSKSKIDTVNTPTPLIEKEGKVKHPNKTYTPKGLFDKREVERKSGGKVSISKTKLQTRNTSPNEMESYKVKTLEEDSYKPSTSTNESDSNDVDLIGSIDHCICSDDDDAALLVRQDRTTLIQNGNFATKEICTPTSLQTSQNKSWKEENCRLNNCLEYCETHVSELDKVPWLQNKASLYANNISKALQDLMNSESSQCTVKTITVPSREKNVQQTISLEKDSPKNGQTLENLRHTTSKSFGKCDNNGSFSESITQNEAYIDCQDACSVARDNENIFEEGDDCNVFCSQVATETNAVLLHALMKIKATGSSPESIFDAEDIQSLSGVSTPKSQLCSKDNNNVFKQPLGIMFQDPESSMYDRCESINTPGTRRLVSNRVAATSSNFGSMFDTQDIFM
ncbi:hypothetical protein PoB_003807400 [Plakobranchus ocellatus]|uniref:Uncharacterized protein n=1 Tax=Plakobranchus ocellatus TaxID=259542 RepID=A0AAV4AUV1_9GAST|nr:hypothetical protein PoB_003807400 [Plakobranchus ocellatus]